MSDENQSAPTVVRGGLETLSVRFSPGMDIRRDLEALAKRENISAATILGAVGSLSHVCLRFAGENSHTVLKGKHEILTLNGMLSEAGVHLHMTVADCQGQCIGGHVVYGCLINTTLELAIAIIPDVRFQRVLDETTGFRELEISESRK